MKDNENENSNEKDKIDYIRLKFSPEQEKLNLLRISTEHGIVCLAANTSDTSRYEFYRINKDGTLSIVFKDKYNISIDDNEVKIRSYRNHPWYQLVRRPGTMSIFEPIITNNHEYLLAEGERPGKVICISLNKNLEISTENIEIDPRTFLSANSFTFGEETICYNKDGAIKIGESYFNLVNQNGEFVSTPEEAIYKVGDKELLLIARKILSDEGFQIDSILGYSPKIKNEPKKINHLANYAKISSLVTSYNNTNAVQNTLVDDKEYICRSDSPDFGILGIIEIKKDGFYSRYVNRIEKNGNIEGEEFKCNGEKIIIESEISKEYLKGQDGKIYYRPGCSNKITEIILPENVNFDDFPCCKMENFGSSFHLLMKEGKLVPISDKYNKFYKLKSESLEHYIVNGKKMSIITAWDSENNRLISFKKIGNDYNYFTIGSNHEIYIGWCADKIIFYHHYSNDIKEEIFVENMDNIKIAKLQGSIDDKDEEVLVLGSKDNKWYKVYNPTCGTKYFCPIYKVGNEIIAVDLREKYSISFGKDLKIKINGIDYDENILNLIYEQNRPKGSVSTVVGKVKIKAKKATGVKD